GGGTAYNAGDNITATTTLYIYDAAGACSDEETFTVTVAPTPIVNNPGNQNVCDSYTLPAITGTNLSGSQGYFDAPNGGGTAYNAGDNITATTTLYIYDAAGACSDEETFTVTVAPTPIVNNPGNQNVCDSYTLPAITGTNLSGSQGYFDAPNGGGTAYSAGDNISTTTTLYIYDATGACSDEETFTITVNNQPDAGTDNTVTVCEGSSLDLNTALMGADTGGSFTDNSATGALSGSTFNTTGLAGSTYTFTYELSAAAPCTPDQATITVTVATAVTAGLDNSDAVCDGASIDLFSVLDGGDLGGTFSDDDGSGGLSGSTFNSTGLSGSFNFTYTVGDGVVCPIDQAVINITIQAAPNIDPITDETACDSYTLTPIGGSNLSGNVAYYDAPNGGGTQYLPGANINSNIRLYAYDEVSGCTDEIDFLITILTSPSIDPMTAVTECGSYTLPTISGSNLSGSQTYYDAPGGTGVSYSAGQTVNSSITLYAYDSNGNCSDEAPLVITITPSPDLTPIGDQNGCDSYTLPAINGTNLTGGEAYYTAPNGGGITYSPGDNISSSTTLYIYDGAANCFDEIAFLVNINNQPEAGLDNAVTVCEGSQLDLTTALSGGDLGGNFNDDDATGALTGNIFNTTGLAGNSYTFTYTLTGGPPCVDDQATITVTVATAVTAGLDNGTSVCAGEALDLITVLNGGDLGGSFNDDDGSGGLSGNLLNTAGLSGNYNFTYTVGDGIVCPVDESLLTITVQSNPDIDVIGDQSACGSFLLPAITGTNLSGNEAYFDAPNGGGTQYLPGQSFSSSISLFIYDISNNGCSDEQTLNIIITPEPEAGADNTVSACIGSQIDLTTALAGADSGGSFNDDDGTGALSGTTFNTNGLSSGMYNFTYTVNAPAPCTPDQALITVELVNSVTAGNDNSTTLCQGAPIDLISLLDGGDLGGTFTDNNGSGALSGSVFNSSGLTGSYSFTYTVGNGVVCPEDQAELTVSISEPPAITAVPVAESFGDYVLPAIAGSNLSGGEAYYDAPNGGGTQYLAGQSISSSITLYLYDINSEGCSDEELLSITISTQPEAGVDNTVSVCVGSQLDLTTALSGADAGGSFTDDSSTGALSGSVFNTTGLASGSYNFTYSIAATAPCQSDQASITVDVVNTVTAGNDNTQALCEGDQIDLTSLLDGGDLGGSFNDDNGSGGLTGSTLNTSGLNGNYQFTYTVGDGQICPEDQALIEVNVVATPVLDQPMDLSDCGTITLPTISGSNVSTNAAYYTGPGGTGTQYAAGDPITSSTLLYIFDDNGNCSDELTFNVTVTPGPALDPVMDALACESFTLPTISGSDLSGNQAYFTGPNGSGTQFLPGAMISNSTSLFVYDNNNGCEVETSFTITINQPVEAGNDNFILACLGASIDLTTTIQGADPGGTFIDDGGTGALTGTVFNSTGLNAGLYTFTYQVSGNTPCPNDEAVISINLLGAPSAGNDNAEQVCAGATVDLTTLLDGADLGGTFTDDSSSGGLSGDQLNTAGLNGSYQFTYSVGGGAICPVDEAILTVNVAPQPQLDMIPDQSGCNSLVLSGIAGSNLSGNVSYFDGPGGTGIAYQPGDVISSTTTLYAYDNNGNCADEQSFTITINTAPTFGTVTVDCDDIAGTYTVSFDIIGGDPISYIVNGNSGVLTNNNFVSDPITSGDPYSFTLDDANGCGPELLEGTQTCACTGTDAGQLSPASLRVCATSAATFTSTNTILNPDDALLFLLHEGDLTTIGNILSTSPTPIFSFDPTTMSTGQTYFVHALAGTSDGNGFIDLNDLCLSQSPGVELSFDPEITGSISGDAAICQGEGTLLTFTLGGGSTFDVTFGSPGNSTTLTGISDGHQELVSPTVTTTYTLLNVSVLNSACNLIQPSNAVTVAVSDLSVQLAVDSDFGGFATSCSNSTDGQASAQISDGVGPYSYLWSDGSTEAVASGLLAGAYGLTVTDAAGCTAIGSVQLTGPQAIEAVVEVQRPTCFDSEDGSITIDTVLGGARPVEVSLDGQLFTQIQDFPFTLSSLPAGNYELTIQDINDCATTTATSVDAPDQLIVVLSADDTLQQGLTADVTTTINFDPVEINWLTDVGLSCTDCLNPSFVVVEDANLTLVAFDENGCSATDDVFIRALKARNVYIPTAFSPNGDGRNETFEVYPGPNVAEVLSLRIFDRWGDLVYEGQPQGAGEGWDGFFKGKLMNPAVFVYVAEVLFVDGVTRIYKGDVTLLR
ncbi:MAG: gliding motility-associated C-terminal domain-containing protein, partial [Bacteroidota bacterium]